MSKCIIKHIRKKYNSAVGMESCQNDPVNALEWTDSLAKTHNQDSQEQIVLKKYTFAYVTKNGRLPKVTKNNCFFIFYSACAMKLNWSA